jgi:PAS domain S-box-containing protein
MELSYDNKNSAESDDTLSESLLNVMRQFPAEIRVAILNGLLPKEEKKLFRKQDLESVRKLKDKIRHIGVENTQELLVTLIYQRIIEGDFYDTLQLVSSTMNIKTLTEYLDQAVDVEEPAASSLPKLSTPESPSALFQQIYSDLTDPALMLDESTLILAMNNAAQNLFGFEKQDAAGYYLQDLSPPQQTGGINSRRVLEQSIQELESKNKLERAWKCTHIQGTVFPCRLTLLQLKTQDKAITVAIIKKEVIEEQKESLKGNYEMIVDNGHPWILKVDKKIADLNGMAVRVLGGKSQTDFLEKGLSTIKPSEQPSGENTDERETRKIVHAVTNKITMYYQSLKRTDTSLLDVIVTAIPFLGYRGANGVSANLRVLHDSSEVASSRYVQWIDRYIQSVYPRIASTFEDYFLQATNPEFIFEMICGTDVSGGGGSGSGSGSISGISGDSESTGIQSLTNSKCAFPVKAVNQAMLFLSKNTYKSLLGTNTVELLNTEQQVCQLNFVTGTATGETSALPDTSATIEQDLRKISETASHTQPKQFNWYLVYENEEIRSVKLDVLRLKIEGRTVFHGKIISSGDLIEGSYDYVACGSRR